MSIFNKTSKRLEALKERVASVSCHTAARVKSGIKGDYPITVHCHGEAEFWESAYLAYHFFKTGAICCEGSESRRYWDIVTDIESGNTTASDGDPIRTMIMRVA